MVRVWQVFSGRKVIGVFSSSLPIGSRLKFGRLGNKSRKIMSRKS